MIEPLYFPNTYISKITADSLAKCFDRVSVFKIVSNPQSLMEKTEIHPIINDIIPVAGDEDRLADFLKEYSHWATPYKGKGGQFLKGSVDTPFFDPTWASQLRTEIKIKVESELSGPEDDSYDRENLLMARAFLKIAQDYDEKSLEISDEFEELERREKKLLDSLHGVEDDGVDDELLQASARPEDDARDAQIAKRLAAWARLFECAWPDPEKTGEGLYITSLRDVVEHVEEYIPGMEHVGDLVLWEGASATISELALTLVECDWNSERDRIEKRVLGLKNKEGRGMLSFYIYPEKNPYELFGQLSGNKDTYSGKKENRKNIRNTVLGLIKK